jgi:hypothetical protein
MMSEWQSIESAPKDGTAIIVSVRGFHPRRPCANGMFVTTARWVWSDNKVGEQGDRHPLEGAFLELNNDWSDEWGGNLGPTHWQPLPPPPSEETPDER